MIQGPCDMHAPFCPLAQATGLALAAHTRTSADLLRTSTSMPLLTLSHPLGRPPHASWSWPWPSALRPRAYIRGMEISLITDSRCPVFGNACVPSDKMTHIFRSTIHEDKQQAYSYLTCQSATGIANICPFKPSAAELISVVQCGNHHCTLHVIMWY